VPTAGAGAANDEIIAGRVTYWFSSITPALPHIREGRLLALGVSSSRRVATLPELPTVAEAGIAGFDSTLWYGVWAPAGTAGAVVDKIAKDIAHAIGTPELRERLVKSGGDPMRMTPGEFASFVQNEAQSVARIVKAAGIKPQ
jgi:tripartite-type tricarboxylate transporter receptor subunit TctC